MLGLHPLRLRRDLARLRLAQLQRLRRVDRERAERRDHRVVHLAQEVDGHAEARRRPRAHDAVRPGEHDLALALPPELLRELPATRAAVSCAAYRDIALL